jgi:hypothetical protein
LFNEIGLAIANVDPLGQAAYKSGGVRLLRSHGGKKMLVPVEQLNAAGHVAHYKVVFQVLEKLARHARILFDIEPGCGHSADDSTLLSDSSESDECVCSLATRGHLMMAAEGNLLLIAAFIPQT